MSSVCQLQQQLLTLQQCSNGKSHSRAGLLFEHTLMTKVDTVCKLKIQKPSEAESRQLKAERQEPNKAESQKLKSISTRSLTHHIKKYLCCLALDVYTSHISEGRNIKLCM